MSDTDNLSLQPTVVDNRVVSGPIIKTVFNLAVPVVLAMLMQFALATTNIFWVGRISPAAQDAVTTATIMIWTMYALCSLVGIGVTALVSRYFGSGDIEKSAFYAGQGMLMGVLLGGILSIIGVCFAPQLLAFMKTSPETTALALPYMRIIISMGSVLYLLETIYATFRAVGNTRLPFFNSAMVVVLNMILDPLLIFGYGPFPELGVTGASVATVISEVFALALMLRVLIQGKAGFIVPRHSFTKIKLQEFKRIARIGLPIATQQFIFVLIYWFLIQIVHQFGESAAAAMGIGNRMESFSYFTCYGFSIAASTMVGQNLGAKKPDRAVASAWLSMVLAIGFTLVTSTLFFTIPNGIAGLFTSDATVLGIAADYLIILGLSQMFMAIEIVLEGAFSGAGDTLPPMIVMIPGAMIRIPLAYYLCFDLHWGINGVWWTLTFTTIVKASVLALWFRLGHWKKKQV